MIVLIDTDVVLDALLARSPFDVDAVKVFAASETGKIDGFVCATTVLNVHYIARKAIGKELATRKVSELLAIFQVAAVTPAVLKSALSLGFADFEDAVIHESAAAINAQGIITRSIRDFSSATIPVYQPPGFISLLDI